MFPRDGQNISYADIAACKIYSAINHYLFHPLSSIIKVLYIGIYLSSFDIRQSDSYSHSQQTTPRTVTG